MISTKLPISTNNAICPYKSQQGGASPFEGYSVPMAGQETEQAASDAWQ